MPRRVRRQGRLIQKLKNEPNKDLSEAEWLQKNTTRKADKYYILGIKTDSTAAWREGEFTTFKKAKDFILQKSDLGISYYVVYGQQSRVLFSREGGK